MTGKVKTRLTSVSHAKTSLVSSSALPVSLSNSNVSSGHKRVPLLATQSGTVVGLSSYTTGSGVIPYVLTVAGNRRMRSGLVTARY